MKNKEFKKIYKNKEFKNKKHKIKNNFSLIIPLNQLS